MRPSTMRPRVHVLVCVHARRSDDPLRSGCGEGGPAVFEAMKRETAGVASRVWVTATGCLGHCPGRGCAVAIHPHNEHLVEVIAEDVPAVLAQALGAR
ncbi:MAG: (2Fe-2S) ferredoxin domain-containing protein [Deltaproteobacteria bacterium]|nr:(2Fe-2S) ferredoxin domain-containing protein [Deltaproteobacteria bacterium]